MSLTTQIRRYARELAGALVLVAIALAVGGYILAHQRLRFPWEDVYEVSAEFSSAQAVTPGQGQNVTVAGVSVGEIVNVDLRDGRALVRMEIRRDKLARVYANAHMFLRPKTGLNDMSIQLDPGRPPARPLGADDVLPVASSAPQVNPDEVIAALDADTRGYLVAVANEGGRALRGRGVDLRELLKSTGPTLRQTERITAALTDRRAQVRRLVHNLRLLSQATAGKDTELARLVDASSATFGALASQEAALRGSLARLPGTLDSAQRALGHASTFSRRLGPTLERLRPAARALAPALEDVRPLLREGEPILRRQIRPLVHDAVPLVADLRPAVADLRGTTPVLVRAFDVLTYVVNELAFNPPGGEEGYLFWVAWFNHNANSILSIEDAHGVAWRGQLITSCSTAATLPQQLATLLAPVGGSPACPPKEPAK